MRFKGEVLQKEFLSKEVNPFLKVACWTINGFFKEVLGKPMTITSVLRQPQTQVDSCKKYGYKSRFEHTAGEAVDIRSRNLSPLEIAKVLAFWNDYLTWFCKLEYHTKGTGKHFHLTTVGEERRQDKICEIVENTAGASACFAG